MSHHQHHGLEHDAQASRSLSLRSSSPLRPTSMPPISEDEMLADPDEPPENQHQHHPAMKSTAAWAKQHTFPVLPRRQSLLTRALHTDSESHDDEQHFGPASYFNKVPSVSSTYSAQSQELTSDDGHASPSTRPSTPGSPRSLVNLPKYFLPAREAASAPRLAASPASLDKAQVAQEASAAAVVVSATAPAVVAPSPSTARPASPSAGKEAAVEATLGRKRCIMFACGRSKTNASPPKEPLKAAESLEDKPAAPALPTILKRACTIKFACTPKKVEAAAEAGLTAQPRLATRHASPAPPAAQGAAAAHKTLQRRHRDSDTTIRNPSPRSLKQLSGNASSPRSPRSPRPYSSLRSPSRGLAPESPGLESCRFHEFASEEDEVDEWTRVSSNHQTPLTVSDTLKKENDIRRLAEEADEEEAMEEEMRFEVEHGADDDEDDEDDLYSDSDVSDTGFQTDDEEGFGASDDDEEDDDSDSDYAWWAPRTTRARSPYVGHDAFRTLTRSVSNSSLESHARVRSPGAARPPQPLRPGKKRARSVRIRPGTPELPDSTDFVCGTLDEDRVMEDAYLSCLEQRRAAKHRLRPQDIDPSFPMSDPEIGSDDDEDEVDDVAAAAASPDDDGEHTFLHGHFDGEDEDEEPRGRRMTSVNPSIVPSPQRLKSPPPPAQLKGKKSCAGHRSPAPISIFSHASQQQLHPRQHPHSTHGHAHGRPLRSPAPSHPRMSSPPPSRRASAVVSPAGFGLPFYTRSHDLTHTASLPRSPHPYTRRHQQQQQQLAASHAATVRHVDEDDEGEASDRTVGVGGAGGRYARGAIDIAQGLERKRLKRREKFYQKYLRKEEKKERKGHRRPCPGKGAQRMRQIGLDNAIYHGKRMLSI